MKRPITFEQAKAQYIHRYTMEHVPAWAKRRSGNGKFYAPQFRTDAEWYENAKFDGESDLADKEYCHVSGETWPLGQWLDAPMGAI